MADPAADLALRRGVLAVSVLDDIDLAPTADGVQLDPPGGRVTSITWAELAVAVGANDPESDPGRRCLRDWLRLRTVFAQVGPAAAWRAEQSAVPLGLPRGHPLHPGPSWVREPVLGGLIDLGVGIRGLAGPDPDYVAVLPTRLAGHLDLHPAQWWPSLRTRLERMGELAVTRLRRDGSGVIAPMGGCDVVTLLGSRALRAHLADGDGTGLRALAVPMRTRGWFDLARIDPAFVLAAAAATDEADRGFGRPLLVTRDEVTTTRQSGDLTTIVLRDPATAEVGWRR